MDEPDYDDLIEDYMEDYEEPSGQEYDEAFLEEIEATTKTTTVAAAAATASSNHNNSTTTTTFEPSPNTEIVLNSPISTNFNGRIAAAATTTTTSTSSPSAAQSRSELYTTTTSRLSRHEDAHKDIFSFERYKSNNTWRQDSNDSPTTMRARSWKTRWHGAQHNTNNKCNGSSSTRNNDMHRSLLLSSSPSSSSFNKLATTPDAQLLQYQANAGLYRPTTKIRISKRDKSLSMQPLEGIDQVSMTLRDGTRIFVQSTTPIVTASKSSSSQRSSSSNSSSNNNNNINAPSSLYSLGISMSDLIRRVQAMERKKEHDKLKALSKTLKSQRKKLTADSNATEDSMQENAIHDGGDDDGDAEGMTDDDDDDNASSSVENNNPPNDQLWVDKHAPHTFANLLSEERTNREVLRALREWDPYVFQRAPPPRPKFTRLNADESNGNNQDDTENGNKNPKDKRPDERRRVILLSGPPGVGKTTLANIIARHCGYRPLEVNGSDERSATALTDRVVRAMEAATLDRHGMSVGDNSSQDWKGRPNCIILDEIDGADAGKALTALVDLIKQDMPVSKDGKQRNKQYLKRPIIFICNNLYAPALRPLLPYARRFQVEAPAPSRLVARLRSVLSSEGLSLWGGATLLNELVTATGGDIRSCLYTLQFAAAEVHQSGKQAIDISKALMSALNGNGMKDDRTDVAGTTLAVFKKSKKGGKDKLWGTKQQSDPRSSVERVLDAVESFGEHSKILDCMYLNILNISYIDPTFDRCAAALQWLSAADHHNTQDRYVPCAAAALHLLCRVEQKPDLTYTTRSITDNRYQMEANRGLTLKFAEGLRVQFRGSRSCDNMVKDTIPYALWMLSAGDDSSSLIRPASSIEILKKKELKSFEAHVAILHSLGLTYVAATEDFEGGQQSKHVSQTTHMILDPPIDRLIQFQSLHYTHGHRRQEIPSAMKELLARGATLRDIRASRSGTEKPSAQKDEEKATEDLAEASRMTPKQTAAEVPRVTPEMDGSKTRSDEINTTIVGEGPPTKKQKRAQNFLGLGARQAKEAKSKRRAKSVGLLRSSKTDKKSNTGSGIPFQQVIRLKYVKGFTQAVRNPCRLEDLA